MECNNDVDIDSFLVQQFSSMATQDREVLVADLQRLLGDQLSAEGCAFFLDMNNWNLQAAVCSYFECQQDLPPVVLPKMSLIVEEEPYKILTIPPNTIFRKTWQILNSGCEAWPPGCCLKFIQGTQMTTQDRAMVDALDPSCIAEVTIELTSPAELGSYQAEWRLSTLTGAFFGEVLRVAVDVCRGSAQVFDRLTLEKSLGISADSLEMDDDEGGQGSKSRYLQATGASGNIACGSGLPPVIFQCPDSLRTLAMNQTNITTCESDIDTMETS